MSESSTHAESGVGAHTKGAATGEPAADADAEDTVEYLRGSEAKTSVARWAEEHEVIHQFLPFDYRDTDPLQYVDTATDLVSSKPVTSMTVSTSDIRKNIPYETPRRYYVRPAILMAGSWPLDREEKTRQYVNPEYVHLDSLDTSLLITDDDEREMRMREALQYGGMKQADIAPWFNLSESGVRSLCARLGFNWPVHRERGRERRAKTWKTLIEWGWSVSELASIFNVTERVIRGHTGRYIESSWEVPEDPSAALPP